MDDAHLWIFLHLPKTGGTTFNGHFARHLDFGETFVHLSRWGDAHRERLGLPPFESWPEGRRRRVCVLSGHRAHYGIHRLVPGRAPRYLTVVRDPAERIVSYYNFVRSRGRTGLDFEAWYERADLTRQRDPMTRFYASRLTALPLPADPAEVLRRATLLLDRCWFVGITARLDADLPHLFGAMGLPATWQRHRTAGSGEALAGLPGHPRTGEVIHRYAVLDEPLRTRLYADHPHDLALFRHALRRHAATRPGGEPPGEHP